MPKSIKLPFRGRSGMRYALQARASRPKAGKALQKKARISASQSHLGPGLHYKRKKK